MSLLDFCTAVVPPALNTAIRSMVLAERLLYGPRYGSDRPADARFTIPFAWQEFRVCGVGAHFDPDSKKVLGTAPQGAKTLLPDGKTVTNH
jgi:hypothetical protein